MVPKLVLSWVLLYADDVKRAVVTTASFADKPSATSGG